MYCENQAGDKFTVELQKAKQSFFKDRMIYYSSFSIQEQGIKGKDWDYRLKAVYVFGILDFVIDEHNNDKVVTSHNKLIDIASHKTFYDKLSFITLQMPNFTKTIDQLENRTDQWLYVLKHLQYLNEIPEKIQGKIFAKLFTVASYAMLNKKEQEAYHESVKYYNDLKNSLDTAFEEGKVEAEKALMPLIEEAKQREEEAILKLASKMKKYGESIDEIITETGLTKEDIENL